MSIKCGTVDKLTEESNKIESKLVSYLDDYNINDGESRPINKEPRNSTDEVEQYSENMYHKFGQLLSLGQKKVLMILLKHHLDSADINLEMLKKVAKKENKLINVLVDELNDIALEITGDIVIDSDYKIINEYYEDLSATILASKN